MKTTQSPRIGIESVPSRLLFPLQLQLLLLLLLLLASAWNSQALAAPFTGPWNMERLSAPPSVEWGQTNGLVQALTYEGEPFGGKPTRVFAYVGRPSAGEGPFPAMVLVHGGGGRAFPDWATHWAKRGYVAIAMDLAGHGSEGRLPDGGPDQSDTSKFRNFTDDEATEMWSYHAVAAVVRGHSLLRTLPNVDANRIGITGISWGGYLTCIVSGLDSRFKVAIPVYGCGFLGDNSYWKERSLAAMSNDSRTQWLRLFDPSQYLANVGYPILFVNGTTDFAYPLDSYLKSYRLVDSQWRHVSVEVNRPHGHIWTFPEVDGFADSVLHDGRPFIRLSSPVLENERMSAELSRTVTAREALICFTHDSGPWDKRTWKSLPAQIDGRRLHAALPEERPIVAFLSIKDEDGWHVSTEHLELAPAPR